MINPCVARAYTLVVEKSTSFYTIKPLTFQNNLSFSFPHSAVYLRREQLFLFFLGKQPWHPYTPL